MHRAIETRIQSSTWPQHGGTIDFYAIYQDDKRRTWLHVVDLKYGKGVTVSSDDNTQLKCYLNLVRERHPNIRWFRATIVQPRVGDGSPQTVEVSLKELDDLESKIMDAMLSDELRAGSHCRWCPAAMQCPKVFDRVKDLAQVEFDELDDVEEIDRCKDFMLLIPVLRRLINEVPQRLLRAMKLGKTVDGWKPVVSMGYRTWNGSEDEVVGTLLERGVPEEDLYGKKLLTPPQLEKLGHKKAVEGLTFRPVRGYSVAPASDKRQAVDLSAAVFDEIPDEDEDE